MAETTLYEKYGQHVKTGKTVFEEGHEGDRMYIIQQGKVRISKTIGGKDHILAILEKGEFFGEMALVNRIKRTATVTAVDDVTLLSFDRKGFQGMIQKNSKIALSVIDKLCKRLQNANQQIQHLVKRDNKGLVALNLYYQFVEHGMEVARLSKGKVVEEISLALEMPQRTVENFLKIFDNSGIIKEINGKYVLNSKEKLNILVENQ